MDEMITWYRQLNDGVKSLIKFLSLALVVGVICVIIINFFFAPMLVSGDSMRPALSDDDIIIIDKVTYRSEEPKRFDLIAFKYKYDYSQLYIKRVIGLPGETLYMDNNNIYILNEETGEFEKLKEYYGFYVGQSKYPNCEKVTLGKDEYFVLGDNRNESEDSRSSGVGVVKKELIVGRACFRLWPFESIGSLKYQ